LSTDTNAGIADPGAEKRPARRVSARTLRIITTALAVVLVLAVAAAIWMWSKADAADDRRRERAAAVAVAGQFALRVDTFDGKDIDKYSKNVQALLTTKYRSEFDKQFEPFKQVYTQAQARGTGRILATGVGSIDADSATVLVAHDASVKSKLGNQERHFRWTIELVKVKDKWLVDEFNPVN
jgi:Mce-associated membrane protein